MNLRRKDGHRRIQPPHGAGGADQRVAVLIGGAGNGDGFGLCRARERRADAQKQGRDEQHVKPEGYAGKQPFQKGHAPLFQDGAHN